MIKLIAIPLLIMSLSVSADIEVYDCGFVGKLSKMTMQARQAGESAQLMMSAFSDDFEYHDLADKIIIDSFDYSERYNSTQIQEKKIGEFENKWFLKCYKKEL